MQQEVLHTLKSLGIPYRIQQHEAVFTVAESSKVLTEKFPVKNLFLVEEKGDRKLLVIMHGLDRLDTKQVARLVGSSKLRFGNEAALLEHLGITPGSVSLFCLLHAGSEQVEVVVDQRLLEEDEVGFHPGANTATVFIPGSAIADFITHTGHHLHTFDPASGTK